MPRGLRGKLRQRAAGRNGVASMPAEKYVKPFGCLSACSERHRASCGCAKSRSRPDPVRSRCNCAYCDKDHFNASGAPNVSANAPANNSKPVSTAKGAPSAPAAATAPANIATSSPAATVAEAPVPPMVLRPMRPREELFVVRSACSGDARAVCETVQAGGGCIVQCLAANAPALSPACKEVLGQFAAQ